MKVKDELCLPIYECGMFFVLLTEKQNVDKQYQYMSADWFVLLIDKQTVDNQYQYVSAEFFVLLTKMKRVDEQYQYILVWTDVYSSQTSKL